MTECNGQDFLIYVVNLNGKIATIVLFKLVSDDGVC